jgi:hypothetical protein
MHIVDWYQAGQRGDGTLCLFSFGTVLVCFFFEWLSYMLSAMGSGPGMITATELAVEVARLKQLISAQVHVGDDDSHHSDAEETAG